MQPGIPRAYHRVVDNNRAETRITTEPGGRRVDSDSPFATRGARLNERCHGQKRCGCRQLLRFPRCSSQHVCITQCVVGAKDLKPKSTRTDEALLVAFKQRDGSPHEGSIGTFEVVKVPREATVLAYALDFGVAPRHFVVMADNEIPSIRPMTKGEVNTGISAPSSSPIEMHSEDCHWWPSTWTKRHCRR